MDATLTTMAFEESETQPKEAEIWADPQESFQESEDELSSYKEGTEAGPIVEQPTLTEIYDTNRNVSISSEDMRTVGDSTEEAGDEEQKPVPEIPEPFVECSWSVSSPNTTRRSLNMRFPAISPRDHTCIVRAPWEPPRISPPPVSVPPLVHQALSRESWSQMAFKKGDRRRFAETHPSLMYSTNRLPNPPARRMYFRNPGPKEQCCENLWNFLCCCGKPEARQ